MNDFTLYMQPKLRAILPVSLAARLDPADDTTDAIFAPGSQNSGSIDEAELRMQQAWQDGGAVKFGQQMWLEFEREWAESRRPRRSQNGEQAP